MSYRISYLVPKKEFEHLLLGKNRHEQYRKHPPKNCPLLAGRRNPRKHHPHPEGTQNRRQQKSGKGPKRPNPLTEKKLGGNSLV